MINKGVDIMVIRPISDLRNKFTEIEDVVKEGDVVKVKVIEIDDKGRINLSIKDCLE